MHDQVVSLGGYHIVISLAEGDLVAIEPKCHLKCYSTFNSRYNYLNKSNDDSEHIEISMENKFYKFGNNKWQGVVRFLLCKI